MSELQSAPNLGAFDERYEIVGEVSGPASAHLYTARRREDGAEVMITVVSAQGGGENNAIAHFASDAQALTGFSHPRIPRVLEGAWTGTDSFAVVSERVSGTTLFELLSAGEVLPNTRIAVALHDIKDALVWAREHNIVHRGVSPETVYFEPETQSLRLLLELTPIPLEGLPDACSDARTLGSLAWSMLTGQAYSETNDQLLGDLRPDLAKAVVEETAAILNCDVTGDEPDVERFVSVIAMADVLRQGEIEVAQMQAQLVEERRVDHRRLEAEAQAAADRAAVIIERLHKERVQFEERIAQDEARIANDEKQIAADREQLEKERQELAACVSQLDRERAAAEQAAATAASTPVPEAATAAGPAPAKGTTTATQPPVEKADTTPVPAGDHVEDKPPRGTRRFGWIVPVGAVAMLLLLILVGSLITRHRITAPATIRIGRITIVPRGPESASGIVPRGGFFTQSVPNVVRGDTTVRPDTTPVRDTTAATDTTPAPSTTVHRNAIVRRSTPVRPDTAVVRESTIARDTSAARDTTGVRDTSVRGDTTVRIDTSFHRGTPTVRRDTTPRRDTAFRPDTAVRIDTTYHRGTPTIRRDTTRDTTFRRDTTRDTTVRRDSTGRPPPGAASFLRR